MKVSSKRWLPWVLMALLGILSGRSGLEAQAVTTGSIAGRVTSAADGSPVPGVALEAVHTPTAATYVTYTRVDGTYSIINVRVGGPFTITARLDGFRPSRVENVQVGLGETRTIDFRLEAQTVEETIVVTAEPPLVPLNQAGSQSSVSPELVQALPTIERSLEDLARTSLYFNAQGGVRGDDETTLSVAGQNNRYNTIQIDGAVNNDLFGLSPTGSPGGQAEAQPISIEAIQELQLLVSPYDVRQGGFTGGGINAITKSGTNAWRGTAFFNTRDESLVGDGPFNRKPAAFDENQYGLSLGGPIVRDKAFFFATGEIQRRETPSGFSAASIGIEADAQRFVNILKSRYNYDPGSIGEFVRKTEYDNYFLRLDFNLGNSQLVARYNLADAANDVWNGSSTLFITPDRAYNIRPETTSIVAQLNSVIGSSWFNEARIGMTNVDTIRDGPTTFPTVEVLLSGGRSLQAGRERFSTANELYQDILEINDDVTFVRGKHLFTIGTHNELFKFKNLFIRDNFGFYRFRSLDDFERGWADRYEHSFSLTSNPRQPAEFKARQFGLYFGDQWRVRENVTLTLGLRADYLQLPDKPSYNPQVEQLYGVRTDVVPDSNLIVSPRLGVNWDPRGDGKQQIRGGFGVFSGRTPWVWLSNQYSNTGIEFRRLLATRNPPINSTNNIAFVSDPANQPKTVGGAQTNEIALTDPDFEMPTVFRGNLAYDQELPGSILATVEVTYSNVLKDIQYKNLNLEPTGRTVVGGRPEYRSISSAFSGVYLLTNTEEGQAVTAAIELKQRPRRGFFWSAGYLWTDAEYVYPGTSSQASSNFINTSVRDPLNPEVAPATFRVEHRFTGTLSYRLKLGPVGSTWTLYFNRQSGRPYSTTYATSSVNVNGDGINGNDLIYVPRSADEVILTGATWAEFNRYIESDPSLRKARGRIVGANTGQAPWTTQLDLRWALDLPVRAARVQVTADLLNLLNLIDSDKGVMRFARFGEVSPIQYLGTDPATGKLRYNVLFTDPDRRFDVDASRSRWRAKLGVRISF